MRKLPTKRNPMAKALASPLFKKRIVAARKGKGSYDRKASIRDDHRIGDLYQFQFQTKLRARKSLSRRNPLNELYGYRLISIRRQQRQRRAGRHQN